MMTDPQRPQVQDYAPAQVKFLLRHYAVLGSPGLRPDADLARRSRRVMGTTAWWENAAIHRAELRRALEWLQCREPRAAYAIKGHLILCRSQTMVAREIGVNQATVSRWVQDGVTLMSAFLRGELADRA